MRKQSVRHMYVCAKQKVRDHKLALVVEGNDCFKMHVLLITLVKQIIT